MKIEKEINPDYKLIKSSIDADFDRTTVKLDYVKGGGYLQPEVSPYITRYVVLNNGRLNKCTKVLAQDTILQNFVFTPKIDEVDIAPLEEFWNKYNKYQLSLAVEEREQYGWGCCEIVFRKNEKGEDLPIRLEQFPAQTACIRKIGELYYAVQRGVQTGEHKLKLFDQLDDYPNDEEHKKMPVCLWLGGGATHEFYDVPKWYPDNDLALAKINLDMFNAENINEGNNLDGILNFIGPPQRADEKGEKPEDKLRRQIRDAGTGTLVMYLERLDPDSEIQIDYVSVSNDNWDYLEKFSASCDDAVMSDYGIPKTRLLINDETESMNSNKSDIIWQIYTIALNQEQFKNELLIDKFDLIFWGIDAEIEIETPVFTDKKQIDLQNLIGLMDKGLITLEQAILLLMKIMPDLDFTDIDLTAPYMKERLYNGNVLGITDADEDDLVDALDFIKNAVG